MDIWIQMKWQYLSHQENQAPEEIIKLINIQIKINQSKLKLAVYKNPRGKLNNHLIFQKINL